MKLMRLNANLLMLALVYSAAIAQNPATNEQTAKQLTPEQQKAQKEVENKTIALLDEIAGDSLALRLVENRIFVLTSVAGVLWKRDETRARALLREAMNQFYALSERETESQVRGGFFESNISIRTYLLQLLAAHDPKLALEFLRATRQTRPKGKLVPAPDFDAQLELNLAVRMAENDPQTALQIAEETLSKDFNQQVLEIWSSLQKKDQRSASQLTSQILAKLKSADLTKGYEASNFAFTMLTNLGSQLKGTQKQGNEQPATTSASASSTLPLAELQQTYKELLELIVTAVSKLTTASFLDFNEQHHARDLLMRTQALLPDVEKYLPAKAAAVRAKLNQFGKAFYPAAEPAEALEAVKGKSVDELLGMASKGNPGTREFLYQQALNKAIEQGDEERAKEIAKDLFGSTAPLEPALQQIEERKIQRAAEQGKFEEARQTVGVLKSSEEKARALITLAGQAAAKDDQKLQRELLDEARELLGTQADTRQQVTNQMLLATAYLPLDADRSFDILETSTDKLNAVMSAILVIDNFDQGGRFKDGEMRMTGADFATGMIDNFDEQLVAFARRDFERTKSVLKRWQINEVRLMVSLALAERILGGSKETRGGLTPSFQ